MRSVLAPVSATAYKNGHQDRYGVVELDATSGDVVWAFDATDPGVGDDASTGSPPESTEPAA